MNSIDRQTLASSVAVVLYLLLVYGLVGQMDCASEQGAEEAHKPLPSRLLCETASNLRCESFEP